MSNWKKESSDSYRYEISIPKGSVANVSLPISSSQQVMILLNNIEVKNIHGLNSGKFKLNNGDYLITVFKK